MDAIFHARRCGLCRSPERERFESELAAGADVAVVQRNLNAEIRKRTGKRASATYSAVFYHRELLPVLMGRERYGAAVAAKPNAGLTDEEILATPIPQLTKRFEHYLLGAGLPAVLNRLRLLMAMPTDKTSARDLTQTIVQLTNVANALADRPAAQGARAETSGPTLSEIAAMISDPEEKAEFIQAQRNVQGTIKEALRLVKKYENGASA
jgi:hypothetical protein